MANAKYDSTNKLLLINQPKIKMKSKLYSVDFKTLYFVLNEGEEPQDKVRELLCHIHCNDLIEDILESPNDYVNIVDIVNKDDIKA